MKSKIRGYEYQIVELYPCVSGDEGFRHVSIHDRLEDATKVLEVLESVNYNFTSYGLMMRPVWENEHLRREARENACDHSGSTTAVSTHGDFVFDCPKCGMHRETHITPDGNPF